MVSKDIETYFSNDNQMMALVIRASFRKDGISFLTEDEQFQQVAYMEHPSGHEIIPHYHNRIPRTVDYTCETLVIRRGKLEVNLYEDQKCIHSFELGDGDIITLFSGGHGFNVLEDVEMVEIKQGPFMGPDDKTRF